MFLDYSRSAVRRTGPMRWVRPLWSHRARIHLAQNVSAFQAIALLAIISLLAATLSITPYWVHSFLLKLDGGPGTLRMLLRDDLGRLIGMLIRHLLMFAPVYFTTLALLLAALGIIWARRIRNRRPWHNCFAILAVGSMPILWFFMLLQAEAVAPLAFDQNLYHGPWNPITNYVRFTILMAGVILLGIWIVDIRRLYDALSGLSPIADSAALAAAEQRA